ncbi:sodium/solute symporter [Actinophytocola gossypii]|uniref:Cation acetate symporter n=1 Tax=Actinophytocola gossypii TaxID=2812003 RepID=A0ABT2JFV1_9PSEU|nr:cation acetate symporter [Actinophytocola gossypii]MCT2586601.1 cation acetate symporter [Actinophytocola gossypii]
MEANILAVAGIALVAVATFYLGYRTSRSPSTTQDFLVARRTVRSRRNAAAVSGEYLSAASFIGVAGLVLKDGADALWYPVGFTVGYLALMLFVAAPLRRSGAYTLPDFCEARLGSRALRGLAAAFVVFIGILYVVPQLQAAGLSITKIVPGAPNWVGALLVTVVVIANVFGGGMRAVTVVQAFQYWLKLFAIAAPTFVLCVLFIGEGGRGSVTTGLTEPLPPTFAENTTLDVRTPVLLEVTEPVHLAANGVVDGDEVSGSVYWTPMSSPYEVDADTQLSFFAGSSVPVVAGAPPTNDLWLAPSGDGEDVFATYSLMLALFLGTMGLPHVLVRFYTNPDGRAARRTTLHVLLLLGVFYLFPILLGALSRLYVPELLVTGRTDAAVLELPSKLAPGILGPILAAVLTAGAFAAFLSTSSGLVVSVSGVLSTDVLRGRVRDFRFATAVAGGAPLALAIVLRPSDISLSVGMSFTLAASTFCPVLLLGVWWRKLTSVGAAAGMVVGGGLVLAALVLNAVSGFTGNWAPALLLQPALVTVPVAFLTVILVSRATQSKVPADVNQMRLRMHAPDGLGFIRDRAVARFGSAEERARLADGRHRK